MNKTSIEWCARPETGGISGAFTWNPIRARLKGQGPKVHSGTFCTRISPGCTNCYASTINKRFGNGLEYTVPNLADVEFFISEKILEEPLRRKKPATIFAGDMFDAFHESIPLEFIRRMIWVVAECRRLRRGHVFQFLTKRAERALEVFQEIADCAALGDWTHTEPGGAPLENLWLGVSVESQKYADERIPLLLQTPAAVRFLSVEPQLEPIDLIGKDAQDSALHPYDGDSKIDWVICGGESGPGARPFNTEWAESLLEQCKSAGVAYFMKQLGANVIQGGEVRKKKDPKGGDMHEWPHCLRVREFPAIAGGA